MKMIKIVAMCAFVIISTSACTKPCTRETLGIVQENNFIDLLGTGHQMRQVFGRAPKSLLVKHLQARGLTAEDANAIAQRYIDFCDQ